MTQKAIEDSKLINFYRTLLPAIGYHADSDGMISHHFPGCHDDMQPVMVGNKRLVLPTLLHRKDPDFERRMILNPMLQNISGSESLVMDKIRDRATMYAGFTISYLFSSLAKLAVRKESHKDLNPSEARYLSPLSDADEGFVQRLENIITSDSSVHRNDREFVKFTIHKGRIWNGEKRQRVAGAHFRLYEQMLDPEFKRVLAGVSMRQKDVKMLKDLFEYVFPDIAGSGAIEFGTDTAIAPSVISLMTVYKTVADRINKMAEDLSGCIPGCDLVAIPTDWWDGLVNVNDLAAEINALPMFEGNNSKNKVMTEQEKARVAQSSMQATEQLAAFKQPVVAAAPMTLGAPQTITMQQGQQYVSTAPSVRPGAILGTPAVTPITVLGTPTAAPAPAAPLPTVTASNGLNVMSMPSAAVAIQQQQAQQQRAAAEAAQKAAFEQAANPLAASQQLPEGARMVMNPQGVNVLYVPAPPNTSGVVPMGAMTLDGRLYVPYQQQQQMPMVNAYGQQVPGMVPQGMMPPGSNMQQMLQTDAATWQGVSAPLAAMLNANPAMKMQYLQQMMQSANQGMYQAQQAQQQQQQAPRYLREVLEEDRQAEINQRNAQFGGAFAAMRMGATVPGMVPGMPVNGYPQGYQNPYGQYQQPYGYPQAGYPQGPHGYVQVGQPGVYHVPPGGGMRPPGM